MCLLHHRFQRRLEMASFEACLYIFGLFLQRDSDCDMCRSSGRGSMKEKRAEVHGIARRTHLPD